MAKRRKGYVEAIGLLVFWSLVIVALVVGIFCLSGLFFMLLWGSFHIEFGWPSHTIAYWPAVGFSALLSVFIRSFKGKSLTEGIAEEWKKRK